MKVYMLIARHWGATIPQTLPIPCSWLAHGLLMGLSWDALWEPYLQGHEFAVIITCYHGVRSLSAIGLP